MFISTVTEIEEIHMAFLVPGHLSLLLQKKRLYPNSYYRRKKSFVSEVGFEPTPSFEDQKSQIIEKGISLESGALDRSAILTYYLSSMAKFN